MRLQKFTMIYNIKYFDKWKKDAKDRVNKLKHGVLTEDEVYEWLVNNK